MWEFSCDRKSARSFNPKRFSHRWYIFLIFNSEHFYFCGLPLLFSKTRFLRSNCVRNLIIMSFLSVRARKRILIFNRLKRGFCFGSNSWMNLVDFKILSGFRIEFSLPFWIHWTGNTCRCLCCCCWDRWFRYWFWFWSGLNFPSRNWVGFLGWVWVIFVSPELFSLFQILFIPGIHLFPFGNQLFRRLMNARCWTIVRNWF